MFDWLIPLLVVVLLLIKILDYLDMLDTVAALLRLIGTAIAGTAKLVVFLIRKLMAAWKPQAWPSPLAAVSGIAAPGM